MAALRSRDRPYGAAWLQWVVVACGRVGQPLLFTVF